MPAERLPPGATPGGLLSFVALGTSVFLLGYVMWSRGDLGPFRPSVEPRITAARGDLAESERTVIDIFESASQSVVNVCQMRQRVTYRNTLEPFLSDAGTGFVWDSDGHIVTNFHVIKDPTAPRNVLRAYEHVGVILADREAYQARVVGWSAEKDLAVLEIDAPPEKLRPVALGTSSDLKVGQTVLAIGNPFGLDQTLTVGVISALNRSIMSPSNERIDGVVQTDAAINPGNSGGPLLDSAGRVIGVNTMIVSQSGGSAGIGFAVPVDTVNVVVPELIAYGRVIRPGLGVLLDLDDTVARRAGTEGAHVIEVVADSAAEKAGLQGVRRDGGRVLAGDIILQLGSERVRNRKELIDAMLQHKVGDKVPLLVNRLGEQLELEVVLQAMD